MVKTVHVFAGQFPDRDAACQYTERQWEPEPGASATDEEYAAWEKRNPIWHLRADLGIYLDSDFVETIDGDSRYEYLQNMLSDEAAIAGIKKKAGGNSNVLVLIFDEALGGFASNVTSTRKLQYCGHFECNLEKEQ
jgi:hypothetical protein